MDEPSRSTLKSPNQPQLTAVLQNKPSANFATPDKGDQQVTYIPGDEGPLTTKYRGVVMKAHVPVTVKAEVAEALRGNPYFQIGAYDPSNMAKKPTDLPKTHIDYRAYVVAWLKTVGTTEELIQHWASDRQLRAACEVGSDDINYLGSLLDPRLNELARQDGLGTQQIAALWIKHGILDLPWR